MKTPLSSCGAAGCETLRLPARSINASGPWLFWSKEPAPALRRSLELQGQLFPVLVDASDAEPVLIAGAARLVCLQELGADALCLNLGALDAWHKGLAYLASNAGQEVGDASAVAALRYFQNLDPGRLDEILAHLGRDARSRAARHMVSWLTLPLDWDALLAAGHVPLACADLLAPLQSGDLAAIFPLFATLAWSRGNAVNVLTWLRETAIREGLSLAALLDRAKIRDILDAGLSPRDAMSRITASVRALRFPELSRMERGFTEAARKLGAGTCWRLNQPDQFETQGVELCVRVASREALHHAVQELHALAGQEAWSAIFEATR